MSDMLAIFAKTLVPPQYDRAETAKRKGEIESALGNCSLRVHHLFESGSWTHGTSISGESDVDYIAWAISAPFAAKQRPSFSKGGNRWM